MLALDEEEYDSLNPRLTLRFAEDEWVPAHEYARLILKVILYPRPLFSEEMLAARLGIDKDNSPDWDAYLAQLPDNAKYKGIFHEAWPRWWSQIVEREWQEIPKGKSAFSREYRVGERVEHLKQYTGLKHFMPAKPIKEHYRDDFATVCEYYGKPLAMENAIMIGPDAPAWHEGRYISLDAALGRKGLEMGLRPHSAMVDRLID